MTLTEQSLSQLLSDLPKLCFRRYDQGSPEAVDALLVAPREPTVMPLRFKETRFKYEAGVIWIRQGHQVIPAQPRHIAQLYCQIARDTAEVDDSGIGGGFPPSPSTIRKFVGRMDTIDDVFRWLKLSDEPRTFLYGKGGSGKTTIAYEIAKIVRMAGPAFRIQGGA